MNYDEIIKNLEQSPMFNLSLSSKELFHSNFLYWLWKSDSNLFLQLIDKLSNSSDFYQNYANNLSQIEVRREYKHFDLCIIRKEKNKEEILLILENKVKSIPYKEQLDRYKNEVKNITTDKTKYVLLSLSEKFPDRQSIEDEKIWSIVNYTTLAQHIRTLYCKNNNCQNYIISDYCEYIKLLQNLIKIWESEWQKNKTLLLNSSDKYYEKAYDLRIHDLYGKYLYSQISENLRNEIKTNKFKKNNTELQFEESADVNNKNRTYLKLQNYDIYCEVAYGYTNSAPLIHVGLWKGDKINCYRYVVQIQNGQYRHAIEKELLPKLSSADFAKKVSKDNRYSFFFNKNESEDKLSYPTPFDKLPFGQNKKMNYCKYGDTFIYQYKKIANSYDYSAVIKAVLADIQTIIGKIN